MKDYQGQDITAEVQDGLHVYGSGNGYDRYDWSGSPTRSGCITFELDEDWDGSDEEKELASDLLPPQQDDTPLYPPVGAKILLSGQYAGGIGDGRSVIVEFEVTKHEWEFDWHFYSSGVYLTISVKPSQSAVS